MSEPGVAGRQGVFRANRRHALQRRCRGVPATRREQRAARQRYLAELGKQEDRSWQQVDALIDTKRPRDYDAAVRLLSDLRDMSGRNRREPVFRQRIVALRETHRKKSTLLTRLTKAGL